MTDLVQVLKKLEVAIRTGDVKASLELIVRAQSLCRSYSLAASGALDYLEVLSGNE